jgi:microcystin-dependent protein
MFAGNFAPRGWAFCDGQLLAVSQNDALFSLFGTIYGGDGRTTFGLPDLRGRIPIHQGGGAGLSVRSLGSKAGAENVPLTINQIPSHTHAFNASTATAGDTSPQDNTTAVAPGAAVYAPEGTATGEAMAGSMILNQGGSQQHSNLMPTLCIHFIVALVGIYPSRS